MSKKLTISVVILFVIGGLIVSYFKFLKPKKEVVEENTKKTDVLIETSYFNVTTKTNLFDKIDNYSIYESNKDDDGYVYYILNDNDKRIIYSKRMNKRNIKINNECGNDKSYDENLENPIKCLYYTYDGYFINKKENKISLKQYDEVSCEIDRGFGVVDCNYSNVFLTKLNNKIGIIDLNGNELVEPKFDKLIEIDLNKFIGKINDKIGLFDIEGKELIKPEYDYLGYSKEFGYIGINEYDIKALDKEYKSISLDEIPKTVYFKGLSNNIEIEDYLELTNLDIEKNNYFRYTSDSLSGNKDVLIFNLGCGEYKNDEIKYKYDSIIYTVDKKNGKITKIDPKKIEGLCIKNSGMTLSGSSYEYTKIEPKSLNNYTKTNKYVINNQTNEKYNIDYNLIISSNEEKDIVYDDIYVLISNNDYPKNGRIGLYNLKDGYLIEPIYEDISCFFHSDESHYACEKGYNVIVDGNKLVSLKDFSIIIDAESINNIHNDNFIVRKDNKDIVYDYTGMKKLLTCDTINYNSDLGYICINKNNISYYNENFKKINMPNIDSDYPLLSSEYNAYNNSTSIGKINLDDNNYFNYIGNESGEKLVYYNVNCIGEDYVTIKGNAYIVENNKLVELKNVEFKDICA